MEGAVAGVWSWTLVSDTAQDAFFLITYNHTLQYYDSLSCLSCNRPRAGDRVAPALFRLFLAPNDAQLPWTQATSHRTKARFA